jgi:prophage regulatory protein
MDNIEHRIIRRQDVEKLTGLKRSALYEFMGQGRFPRPIKLGSRAIGWLAADVQDWIAARVAESRAANAADAGVSKRKR